MSYKVGLKIYFNNNGEKGDLVYEGFLLTGNDCFEIEKLDSIVDSYIHKCISEGEFDTYECVVPLNKLMELLKQHYYHKNSKVIHERSNYFNDYLLDINSNYYTLPYFSILGEYPIVYNAIFKAICSYGVLSFDFPNKFICILRGG